MAYYRKNKRRFDPRYFMNERVEGEDEVVEETTLMGDEEKKPDYGEQEELEEIVFGEPTPGNPRPWREEDDDVREFPGGTLGDIPSAVGAPRSTSLGSRPTKKTSGASLLSVAQQMRNLENACSRVEKKRGEVNRIFNKPKIATEGCGDVEELPWVEMDGGKLTAASEDDLDSILNTAEIWQRGGIEIINGRADILDALGIEVSASESLPSLMDEEPPLEE